MYRREYKASVCPDTISLKQDHFPVVADIRLHRKKPKDKAAPIKSVGNTHKFEEDAEMSQREV